MVLGARRRDVEQTALFLDFGRAANPEVGRYATVHAVEDEDRLRRGDTDVTLFTGLVSKVTFFPIY